jgi:6-pyruvoyltetrahydropterin/6-carboxytetrahydropterin synthase
METIRVHSEFHAAHRQLGYPGKCRHVHGHTWRGTIVIAAQDFPRDELEMTIDFGDVKDVLRQFDHKMIVCDNDELFTNAEAVDPGGVIVVPGTSPTVENISHYCLDGVASLIGAKYPDRGISYRVEVTIIETDHNIFTADATFVI